MFLTALNVFRNYFFDLPLWIRQDVTLWLNDIGSGHPAERKGPDFRLRHEFLNGARFPRSQLMIELIENHDTAAGQPRPEVFQTALNYFILTCVQEYEFELHVSVFLKEPIQAGSQIQLVNMDEAIELLGLNQTDDS
jgi:hypothetical protein